MNFKKKGMEFGIEIVLLLVLDQVTKYLAVIKLKGNDPVNIIKGVLELHYLENESAAFGLDPVMLVQKVFRLAYFTKHENVYMNTRFGFLIIITILICSLLILFYFKRIPDEKKFLGIKLITILIISGAIGNFIDRVSKHYVVDFIYFKLIDFPIFNVADIYITAGAFLLILLGIFYYKEEDFEKMFPSKKKSGTEAKEQEAVQQKDGSGERG